MKRPLCVTIVGLCLSGNKGGPAILSGLMNELRNQFGEVRVRLLSPHLAQDLPWQKYFGVELEARPRLSRPWHLFSVFWGSDFVIDMHGVKFCGNLSFRNCLSDAFPILVPKLMGIPVICFTQTYGPFENWNTKMSAKFSLSAADSVLVRDLGSMRSLEELRLNKTLELFPDIAFAMAPTSYNERPVTNQVQNFLMKPEKWIGLNISAKVILSKQKSIGISYENIMKEFIEWLLDAGHRVLLIPHTYTPMAPKHDDTTLSRRILKSVQVSNAENLLMIDEDLSPGQLKAIIGMSHLFVGSRYHALIAALSMGVPSLAIGWNYKYDGLFSLFGLEEFSLNVESLELQSMIELFKRLELHQENLRTVLLPARLPTIIGRAKESLRCSLEKFNHLGIQGTA